MSKIITSLQNPLIKNIVLLSEKARERRQQGLFVAEGLIELSMAFSSGLQAEQLLFDPQVTPTTAIDALLQAAMVAPSEIIEVNRTVMEKIAYRANVPNAVGVFLQPKKHLEYLELPLDPLLLILETVEKPGNLGAILRTADAAGVDAVILCDAQTDWYNPNVIRASLGAVFTLPVFTVPAPEALTWLRQNGIEVFVTHLEASYPYDQCNFNQPAAIVMGTEADGITDFWVEVADQRVIIPMYGQVDSMNVSVSTGILLFEAVRQRRAAQSL
jgi:TrmH family RNA methyltransferase